MKTTYERRECFAGSRMPVDPETHWSLRNPINLIPGAIVLAALLNALAILF